MRFSFGVHAPPSVVQGEQACIPILEWWGVQPDFHRLAPCSFDELRTILTLLFARCFQERAVDLTEVPGCSPQPRAPPGPVLSRLFLGWCFSPLPQGPDFSFQGPLPLVTLGPTAGTRVGLFSLAASPSREAGVSRPQSSCHTLATAGPDPQHPLRAPQRSRLSQTM